MPNTIFLKGRGVRKETISAAVITPGYLCSRNSSNLLIPHGVAAGSQSPMFAFEDELNGNGIDVDWASGDQVVTETMPSGNEVYAKLPANAPAIVVGDYLDSNGDGTLRKVVTSAATADTSRNSVVARALEAVNNSAVGVEARIKVEVV